MCLYSFHWFYYKELLRKSIATAFKLHVELITDRHHPYTFSELLEIFYRPRLSQFDFTLYIFFLYLVSLPFSILANLLSSGFYQIQKVFTTPRYSRSTQNSTHLSIQCIFIIDFVCFIPSSFLRCFFSVSFRCSFRIIFITLRMFNSIEKQPKHIHTFINDNFDDFT